jgi:tryptophan synthase alpha chain
MSAIDEVFFKCSHEGRAAFIPFLMAGDPDLNATAEYMEALAAGGADIIELGVPFSDPIADGPVNQRAAVRALEAGTKLSGILQLVARHRDKLGIPIVLFTYFNPLHARGVERFAEQAAASGVDGILCVDLPPEEGERDFIPALREQGVDTIFLLAPTSTRERVSKVGGASTGFVYYVSRTGVTGERTALPTDLVRDVKRLRKRLDQPLAVGFGLSTPEQVAEVGEIADGVVVGSAFVRLIEENAGSSELPLLLEDRVRDLSAPLRQRGERRRAG